MKRSRKLIWKDEEGIVFDILELDEISNRAQISLGLTVVLLILSEIHQISCFFSFQMPSFCWLPWSENEKRTELFSI